MTTVFKSPINADIAARSTKIAPLFGAIPITIEPNTSIQQQVTFGGKFPAGAAVFVTYSVSCDDNSFGLNHNLRDLSAAGFAICIENQINAERAVSVQFKAETY